MTPLMSSSLGQVVAEDVPADRDLPPFEKSMMDGYALRFDDLTNGTATLRITEEIAAGRMPVHTVNAGEAARIFTGAPVPARADTVVMQERTSMADGVVAVEDASLVRGKNIICRGAEMAAGAVVVPAGSVLNAAAFGILASVGRTRVKAIRRAKVAIIATGDELVEPNRTPEGAQIRNSNGPMLTALVDRAGALPRYIGIAPDTVTALRSFIAEGLEIADVVLLAGGVSAGKLDLVPQVLAELGVTAHFHRVRMKPGKPLLFGTKGAKHVFGLPGNPVSSLAGFELFVKPLLRTLMGHSQKRHETVQLRLTVALTANHDRSTYHPAVATADSVTPAAWFGSADLRATLVANAFIVLPAGEVRLAVGESACVIRW
jgi:molybdopterin molybdotransferase